MYIRVRTGKDPVVLLGMLAPRLYNLPDEFSIQEEQYPGRHVVWSVDQPLKVSVCVIVQSEIGCLELAGTFVSTLVTISSHCSERWLRQIS